jgi:hypothetical protein
LAILLALVVGIGLGVALDRFVLNRATNPADVGPAVFEQTGALVGHKQGEVHFPLPYALPPHVELKTTGGWYVIVETTATGFKWLDDSIPTQGQGGTWHAKGVKASRVP